MRKTKIAMAIKTAQHNIIYSFFFPFGHTTGKNKKSNRVGISKSARYTANIAVFRYNVPVTSPKVKYHRSLII